MVKNCFLWDNNWKLVTGTIWCLEIFSPNPLLYDGKTFFFLLQCSESQWNALTEMIIFLKIDKMRHQLSCRKGPILLHNNGKNIWQIPAQVGRKESQNTVWDNCIYQFFRPKTSHKILSKAKANTKYPSENHSRPGIWHATVY